MLTISLGLFCVLEAGQPKGSSIVNWETMCSDGPWGQGEGMVHNSHNPIHTCDADHLIFISNLG